MTKTVCIVGAGPSGLVAAKTLIHDHPGLFHVTVLEQSHRIGGLWPISKVEDDGLVNPEMRLNQSRHTVSFSDLAWSDTAPQFPRAWQVGQYLEQYITTYPGYEIRNRCQVRKTERKGEKWEIHLMDYGSITPVPRVFEFDHLIVATGFFGRPIIPSVLEGFEAPVWHSSRVRDVESLLVQGIKSGRTGKRIVVVGGQMSGVEIAAHIAFQLSSATHSIEKSSIPDVSEYSVTHVVQKPFWVMPFLFPKNPVVEVLESGGEIQKNNNSSPNFLPLDLVSYNLAGRPPGPIENSSGAISPEVAGRTHGFMKSVIGSDQSEFGSAHIVIDKDAQSEPPWLAVSDQYNEFVRSGKITTVRGKVTAVASGPADSISITDGEENISLDNVAAVVFATGFDAASSVKFLPEDVLNDLKFDPKADKFPLALDVHSTASRAVPSLGFVGFYRSQYWGVMEMQARFLGKLWSGDSGAAAALANDKTVDSVLDLRSNPRTAQFPMGDYPYLMESFSEILGIKRTEPEGIPEGTRTGIVFPARYQYDNTSHAQREQANIEILTVNRTLDDSVSRAKFVSRAIFKAMQGEWTLERKIESRRSDYPSGILSGVAQFHPRAPTEKPYDMEYLYTEKGEFRSEQGFNFTATRNYAYRYREDIDALSAWFVKPKDNKTVDYLFHELEIILPADDSNLTGSQPWRAKSAHLCIKDMYNVKYDFRFKGVSLESWTQEYTVDGPAKDYTIRNVYKRPPPAVNAIATQWKKLALND